MAVATMNIIPELFTARSEHHAECSKNNNGIEVSDLKCCSTQGVVSSAFSPQATTKIPNDSDDDEYLGKSCEWNGFHSRKKRVIRDDSDESDSESSPLALPGNNVEIQQVCFSDNLLARNTRLRTSSDESDVEEAGSYTKTIRRSLKIKKNDKIPSIVSDEDNEGGSKADVRKSLDDITGEVTRPRSERRKKIQEDRLRLVARTKTKAPEKEENLEIEGHENLFKDSDIFSQDDSDGMEALEGSNHDHNEDMDEEDDGRVHCRKTKLVSSSKPKRPTKSDIIQTKSEQQRLCREQQFKIPYHIPEVRSIQDFLARVPQVQVKSKTPTCQENSCGSLALSGHPAAAVKSSHAIPLSVLSIVPKLKARKGELLFHEEKEQPNEPPEVDVLLQKCIKQTSKPTASSNQDGGFDVPAVVKTGHGSLPACPKATAAELLCSASDAKLPGSNRILLKKQLLGKMREQRRHFHEQQVQQQRFLETEKYSDDEEDAAKDGDSAVDDVQGSEESESEDNCGDPESDDEELNKWNEEDEQKKNLESLELEMKIKSSPARKQSKSGQPLNCDSSKSEDCVLSAPDASDVDDRVSVCGSVRIDCDDTLSTVSSTIPAGQGEPSGKPVVPPGGNTPVTKLLMSGLLGSATKSTIDDSSTQASIAAIQVSAVPLPFENTQDLYHEEEPREVAADFSEDPQSRNFLLGLDEDAQFDHILDSQGFLQPNKKGRSSNARRLFEEELTKSEGLSEDLSMSHLLGLCSGKFSSGTDFGRVAEPLGLPSDLPLDRTVGETEILGLCSGEFPVSRLENEQSSRRSGLAGLFGSQLFHADASKSGVDEQVLGLCSGTFTTQAVSSDGGQELESGVVRGSRLSSGPSDGEGCDDQNESSVPSSHPTAALEGLLDRDSTQSTGTIGYWSGNFATQKLQSRHSSDREKEIRSLSFAEKLPPSEERLDDDKENWPPGLKPSKCASVSLGPTELLPAGSDESGAFDKVDDCDDVSDEEGKQTADEGEEGEEQEEAESGEASDVDNELMEDEHEEMLEWKEIEGKKRLNKKAFYENEAELSGSDVGSDEDEDLGSEYDEYEEESDVEDLPSAEKLKYQVNRIHQRKMLDQDIREVRLLQELYLEDGDLQGTKRQRQFRWRNIDAQAFAADDGHNSDGDEIEDVLSTEVDVTKRIERHERETFLRDQENSQQAQLDADSQSILGIIRDTSSFTVTSGSQAGPRSLEPQTSRSIQSKRSGSFLCRNKSALTRLSAASAGKSAGTAAKSFVFQAVRPEKEGAALAPDKQKTRRPVSFPEPAAKRPRLNDNISRTKSVFNLL